MLPRKTFLPCLIRDMASSWWSNNFLGTWWIGTTFWVHSSLTDSRSIIILCICKECEIKESASFRFIEYHGISFQTMFQSSFSKIKISNYIWHNIWPKLGINFLYLTIIGLTRFFFLYKKPLYKKVRLRNHQK